MNAETGALIYLNRMVRAADATWVSARRQLGGVTDGVFESADPPFAGLEISVDTDQLDILPDFVTACGFEVAKAAGYSAPIPKLPDQTPSWATAAALARD